LSKSDKIILREQSSYDYVATTYALKDNVVLYRDFWHDIVDSQKMSTLADLATNSISSLECPYLIVNCNPYIDMSMLTEALVKLTETHQFKDIVYFPGDKEDKLFLNYLSTHISSYTWTLFDWTRYDIWTAIALVKWASYGVWVRLHVLAMFQRLWVPYDYIVYQEKIEKFLANQTR
jgi:hypothetical protein